MAQPRVVVKQFIERRPRPKSPYGRGEFMIMSRSGFAELKERVRDRSLGMQAICVLYAMLEHVDYGNRIEISQADLALDLAMSQSDVSKASRALLHAGVIRRHANRRGWYEIDPRMGWKGNVESLEAALQQKSA